MRLRCRACAPGSLTQRVLRSQTILLDSNEHLCNTASPQSPVEKPLASRNTIRLSLIPQRGEILPPRGAPLHGYLRALPSATHHSGTSIPGSAGRTPPALSLQGGWSLRLRRNACRPVILTQCVQLWDHSWYTYERLRTATFTRACFHTPLHKRASTQRSLSAEPCGAI